jgi:hypothetical protein
VLCDALAATNVPASPADVTPMDGLEPVEFRGEAADMAGASRFEEFVLEREEEIVLHSTSGAEYQVANDSESLLDRTRVPAEPEAPAAPEPEPEPEPEPATPPPSSSSVIAEELEATRSADRCSRRWRRRPCSVGDACRRGRSSSSPSRRTAACMRRTFDAAIEGIAPVDGRTPEAEDEAIEAESGALVLMVTEKA